MGALAVILLVSFNQLLVTTLEMHKVAKSIAKHHARRLALRVH